ncbi:hypothetical protein QTP70_012352 [Hemibagrus guttatus]|uniref:ribonuclease H n=1 Tax=Hemibagrus guttatus TaxID=175788 RepID=A0AAE0Q4D6_9TELE|nr:hypothetical protein QTP70_012352 [Hemibagrus guttatus]
MAVVVNPGLDRSGKGRELADMMERRKVDILCVQETRWKGSKARSIGAGFKLFYYGVDSKRNGVGVVLKEEFVRNVLEVKRVSDRVMSLKLEFEGVMLNVVSGYAPQVGCELEEKERFWSELDEVMESIPTGERVVIGADFNGHVGEGNTGDEEVMGKFGVKERNLEGQMVVDFAKRMDMGVVNTYFQKREEHRVTYKSGGRRTQVVLPDDWETTAEVIRETGRKVLGVSSGRRKEDKETWWWNEEVQDSIQRKRLAKKKWDMDRTEENRQEYKELQRRVKREVSKAKQKAYEELYTRLDTREGEKDLYRLARQRDRDGKDVQQKVDKIRKDEVRKALKRMKSGKAVGPDDIPVEVWKCLGEAAVEFLANLFNRVLENLEKAYDRVPREELWYCMRKSGVAEKYVRVVQDMYERSRTVVRCAVVMDQLSEEVRQESPWTMMFADDIVICSESREQVEENLERWRFALERRGMKVSRIQSNGECGKEKISARIKGKVYRTVVRLAMLYGLETVLLRKRQESELESVQRRWKEYFEELMNEENEREKRVEGVNSVEQKVDKIRKDEVRKALKRMKSGKAVGPDDIPVEVWKCLGEAAVEFLTSLFNRVLEMMDQLSEEVRQESPWTMMFADDIVICSESREQVEENLERWRFALERRGMKVSHSKTEYMCVNEREGSGTVRLQGEEVMKVQEFKYLGSTVQSNGECGKEEHLLVFDNTAGHVDGELACLGESGEISQSERSLGYRWHRPRNVPLVRILPSPLGIVADF